MFETTVLRSFLAVVDLKHFTAASQSLGISQSTVSQHIRRLELEAGRQLIARDTHAVALTADGVLMADFARDILQAKQRAIDHFTGDAPRDRLRFGVSEDLVLTRLPELLRDFMAAHPRLSVELSVGLTGSLYQSLDAGQLDLIFTKRRPGDSRGRLVWRENLAWLAHSRFELAPDAPVPLALYSRASITGGLAVEALNQAGRPWFKACASETLSGLRAATLGGSVVTAQSRLLLQSGELSEAPASARLPPLGEIEFVVVGGCSRLQGCAAALAETIQARSAELWTSNAKQDEVAG